MPRLKDKLTAGSDKIPRRKQRGIFAGYFSYYIAASGGEYNLKVIQLERGTSAQAFDFCYLYVTN